MTSRLLTPADAGLLLGGIKVSTLAGWRVEGSGPRFVRIGSRIFYRDSDLQEWLESRTFASTAAAGSRRRPKADVLDAGRGGNV